MKKNLILAMAVVAAMVSCQKEVEPAAISQTDGDAISFSAYTSTAVTRGAIDSAKVDNDSIGVFAFYQGTEKFNTHKFVAPNFMYNQKVKDGSYSPVKYWPNNTGDMLSFFAYTPYKSGKQWEDMGITTDVNGKKMTVSFPIYQEVADQVDYIWADPTFNMKKPNVTETVKFNFKHITSQVSLYVGVEKDAANKYPTYWGDSTTTITVNSVEFKGLYDAITYKYDLAGTSVTRTDTCTGLQDITLTSENFVAEAAKIDSVKWYSSAASTSWVTYNGHDTWKQLTDPKDNYMFLAPQTFTGTNDFVFTYTVKTTDSKNSANDSEITNVIKSNLSTILGGSIAAGKAYKIYCLIGMTSVKFIVSIEDWAAATSHQVNVPANN